MVLDSTKMEEFKPGEYCNHVRFCGVTYAFNYFKNHPVFKGRFKGILIKSIWFDTDGSMKAQATVVCSDQEIPSEPNLEIIANDGYTAINILAELAARKHGDLPVTTENQSPIINP